MPLHHYSSAWVSERLEPGEPTAEEFQSVVRLEFSGIPWATHVIFGPCHFVQTVITEGQVLLATCGVMDERMSM